MTLPPTKFRSIICRLFGHPSWRPVESIPYDECRRCGELRLVEARLHLFKAPRFGS